ncbi:MAG TPA: hypothetical protein VIQ05_18760 [Tardiphaga sp.]
MGEIIRFVPRSECGRVRLTQEARAIYGRIFPPADAVSEARNRAPASHAVSGGNAHPGHAAHLWPERIAV